MRFWTLQAGIGLAIFAVIGVAACSSTGSGTSPPDAGPTCIYGGCVDVCCEQPGETCWGLGDDVWVCCAQPAKCESTNDCCGFSQCVNGTCSF